MTFFNYMLSILFGMLLIAGIVAGQPNQSPSQNKQSTEYKNALPSAANDNHSVHNHPTDADHNSPKWYAALKRPEWWLVIVAALTLIFIALQAYETKEAVERSADSVGAINGQTAIMQGQLDTMKGQLELEHRPWIAVAVEPSSPIIFDERGCVLMCKVTMTNVGHSVARHVSLWIDFALSDENPTEIKNRLCNIMRHPQNENSDYGWLLFPNQSAVEQRPVIAIPDRVKKALERKTFQGMDAIGLHLVGCVDYPSPLEQGKRHQTTFTYLVSGVGASRRMTGAFDPAQKIYQAIDFAPTMHGASADQKKGKPMNIRLHKNFSTRTKRKVLDWVCV